jgi:hypothetical protein
MPIGWSIALSWVIWGMSDESAPPPLPRGFYSLFENSARTQRIVALRSDQARPVAVQCKFSNGISDHRAIAAMAGKPAVNSGSNSLHMQQIHESGTWLNTPTGQVTLLILVTLAARLLFAALLELGIDESYMVAAGRTLQLSYFDHPPIAWWMSWGRPIFSARMQPGRCACLSF